MGAISSSEDFMFQLKVLTINKSKIHVINMSNCTLYIVKFLIGFDTLFWTDICRFSERGCRFMR